MPFCTTLKWPTAGVQRQRPLLSFRPEDDHLWDHLVFQRAYRNAQQLIAEGRDLLHIVCDRARAKGLLIYPSLQVQADLGEGLRIGDTQLADFARPEVRDMRFALIEETLQNYPVDGFELNLNHYAGGAFFHPDDMERGRSIFTDWLQRVREAVKQSGPDRELALRIPASIAGCQSLGLDPETWIREGIADVLVAENFASMSLIDVTADFRPLIAAAQDADCRIHGVIRNNVDSDRLGAAPIAMVRAAATNYWAQDVDGLNLVPLGRQLAVRPVFLRTAPRAAAPGRDGGQRQNLRDPHTHRAFCCTAEDRAGTRHAATGLAVARSARSTRTADQRRFAALGSGGTSPRGDLAGTADARYRPRSSQL